VSEREKGERERKSEAEAHNEAAKVRDRAREEAARKYQSDRESRLRVEHPSGRGSVRNYGSPAGRSAEPPDTELAPGMPWPAAATPWLVNLIQGVTLVSIIGFAFWLGQMSGKITETSTKLDKLYGLTLESRDALSPRMAAIEAKLDSIEKKLDAAIEKKVNTSLHRTLASANVQRSEGRTTAQPETEGH
jgi:hypothetical protein